jgi:hypothetical protein
VTLTPSTTTTTSTSTTTSVSTLSVQIPYCPSPPENTPVCIEGDLLVPWKAISVPHIHADHANAQASLSDSTELAFAFIALDYSHPVLLRLVDAGYKAEQYSIETDDGEHLGITHPTSDSGGMEEIHTHCGTAGGEETANKCLALGFSEGTVVVPANAKGVRVTMFYSARSECSDCSVRDEKSLGAQLPSRLA